MIERVLAFSIAHRGLVVLATIVLAAAGAGALVRLPIDAVPDITNQQVQINTVVPSLSPVEVEKQVTFPIETALAGIPGLDYTRSLSRNGFSQVTAVFRDDVDIYFARQQVTERLGTARRSLPDDAEPMMGPISTGLGEIYMWTVEYAHPDGRGAVGRDGEPGWQSDGTYLTPEGEHLRNAIERATYLRTVQDWIIRPQLKGVEGVAAIDGIGGYVKQYQVQPDPRRLAAYDVTFHALVEALERNNVSVGAGYVEHNGEAYVVRAAGRVTTPEQLAEIPVRESGGTPIRVRDVATVAIGAEPRIGSATENGEEVVLGTALMLLGANSRTVAAAVDARLAQVNATLPPDVRARAVLNRMALVDATIATVARNLGEGAVLVIAVLFLLLGNIRAALITALAIPLAMLLTAIGMVQTRTSGNLMSLGAIDFGLIVDGAVIIVENCLRVLADRQRALGRTLTAAERAAAVLAASTEVRGATAFGEAIIIVVYVPILTLTGIEGRMFRPMALTVIFALTAAFVLSLTFIPAMMAWLMRGRVQERENILIGAATRGYEPLLRAALRRPGVVCAVAVAALAGGTLLFRGLGQEFVPTLGELDLLVEDHSIPGTSLTESTDLQKRLQRRVAAFPEVASAFSRSGTADMATDPMPISSSDLFIMLAPRAAWPNPSEPKDAVRRRIEAAIEDEPGHAFEMTQPIQMRFNELLAGVRSDLAVKVFGDEFDTMLPVAQRLARVLRAVPGAADTRVEPVEGAPVLTIDPERAVLARYGLTVADVQEVAGIAIGGRRAGSVWQGDRRFDVVVRLAESYREDERALARLPVMLSHADRPATVLTLGGDDLKRAALPSIPLGAVASLRIADGPNQISRDNGKRRIVVTANVRGRDIGSFVAEAQQRIAAAVRLPPDTWLEWGGEFEHLVRAKQRLIVIVPVCFLVILILLYGSFDALGPALIVFTGVPLALIGGIVALWLRAMSFSISAAVGFIALSGVAVLNGLVMITFIDQVRAGGVPPTEAIVRGAVRRLRPVLATALVASLGFMPMAFATGTGAEVQRPLATVVIGGLISSTGLTLFVLPAMYSLFAARIGARERHSSRLAPAGD
jgi:cobalt-zinc-cadmium resistance protein CzcA